MTVEHIYVNGQLVVNPPVLLEISYLLVHCIEIINYSLTVVGFNLERSSKTFASVFLDSYHCIVLSTLSHLANDLNIIQSQLHITINNSSSAVRHI